MREFINTISDFLERQAGHIVTGFTLMVVGLLAQHFMLEDAKYLTGTGVGVLVTILKPAPRVGNTKEEESELVK